MSELRISERGTMAVEVVILTPVLVAAIMALAAGARLVDARGDTVQAAFVAARAASLTGDREAALRAGLSAARRDLAQRGRTCAHLEVSVLADDFRPGGSVRVSIACTADLSDLLGFGLPGSKTFRCTGTAPLESHRSMP